MKEGMKITMKKSNNKRCVSHYKNLPFDQNEEEEKDCPFTQSGEEKHTKQQNPDLQLAESFKDEGNKLAEDGRYKEALGKWEAAITLIPDKAVLHEQKAQVLLEIGDDWNALKAAARATKLEPSWAEAWITLARTQLNFGEPDAAIESFDRALAIKPDSKEARDDRQTALHLVKRRKQLQLSGLSSSDSRFIVGDVSRACEGI